MSANQKVQAQVAPSNLDLNILWTRCQIWLADLSFTPWSRVRSAAGRRNQLCPADVELQIFRNLYLDPAAAVSGWKLAISPQKLCLWTIFVKIDKVHRRIVHIHSSCSHSNITVFYLIFYQAAKKSTYAVLTLSVLIDKIISREVE